MNKEKKDGLGIAWPENGNSPCDWCVNDPDGDLNWEWNGKAKEDANDQS